MCLIGNMELLCTQCRGIKPHLLPRGMSRGISRVAAGTLGIFSSTARMAIQNSTWFSEVRTPFYLQRTPQESKLGLAG